MPADLLPLAAKLAMRCVTFYRGGPHYRCWRCAECWTWSARDARVPAHERGCVAEQVLRLAGITEPARDYEQQQAQLAEVAHAA